MTTTDYLTEQKLITLIAGSYTKQIITQYSFPDTRYRFDLYLPESKVILEFDGDQHFCSYQTIQRDIKKDKLCSENGITLIRIPYFLQMVPSLVDYLNKNISGLDLSFVNTYPNGFIDKKAKKPCDWTIPGITRFRLVYTRFFELLNEYELIDLIEKEIYQTKKEFSF